MAESNISWTHFSINFWIGCTRISPACDSCYAAEWAARYYKAATWGKPGVKSNLVRTSESTRQQPRLWNKRAAADGIPRRVFPNSFSDIFDSDADPAWRDDFWALVRETPWLDWMLLTKRPSNIGEMLPADWGDGYPNVWLGATAENQEEYDRRRLHLLAIPASAYFFSVEPMLGPVIRDLANERGKNVGYICGGESGTHRRPMNMGWVEKLWESCRSTKTPFFFKQDTAFKPGQRGRASDALWACKELPASTPRPAIGVTVSVTGAKKPINQDLFGPL